MAWMELRGHAADRSQCWLQTWSGILILAKETSGMQCAHPVCGQQLWLVLRKQPSQHISTLNLLVLDFLSHPASPVLA